MKSATPWRSRRPANAAETVWLLFGVGCVVFFLAGKSAEDLGPLSYWCSLDIGFRRWGVR